MDPLLLSLLGGAGQAGLGVLGYLLSGADREKAQRIMEQAADEYGNIDTAKLEQLVASEMGPSAMEGIRTDPRLRSSQYAALDRLEQMGREGLTLDDKAAQNEAMRAAARQESAGRQRIAEDFQARGQLGGGAQLAMQLQNQQGAADRASQVGMQTAANSQRRMFDAMMQGGKLASDLRGQEFNEQERIAQARDAVNRYNAGARQQHQQWQHGALRQAAADKLKAQQMKAGIYGDRAQATQGLFGAVGGGLGQAANIGANYMQGQQSDARFNDALSGMTPEQQAQFRAQRSLYGR